MAKKRITITLYLSDVLYHIKNKTDLRGRALHTAANGGNDETVAQLIANDDENSKDEILRCVKLAFNSLKNVLSEYINEEGTTADNLPLDENANELVLALDMPSNYDNATRGTLAEAGQEYVVNTAIGTWFMSTNKQDAADYMTLAQGSEQKVVQAMNKRVRPTRPTIRVLPPCDVKTVVWDGTSKVFTAGAGYYITGATGVDEGEYDGLAVLENGYCWTDGTVKVLPVTLKIISPDYVYYGCTAERPINVEQIKQEGDKRLKTTDRTLVIPSGEKCAWFAMPTVKNLMVDGVYDEDGHAYGKMFAVTYVKDSEGKTDYELWSNTNNVNQQKRLKVRLRERR